MAAADTEDMDSANNNSMSNNNNSSNINNNAVPSNLVLSSACSDPDSPCSNNNDGNAAATAPTVDTNSRSRGSSSRRGRSGGRSRSRRRHSQSSGRRGSRHQSRQSHKQRERNFPSALCSMISIVILCTALAEPSWIRIDDGHCSQLTSGNNGGPPFGLESLRYLGALQFFYFGNMVTHDPSIGHKVTVISEYRNGPEDTDRLVNCVTERVVMIFKIIIALTFLAILTSLISFSLDLVGLEHRLFKLLRRSAVFNIFTGDGEMCFVYKWGWRVIITNLVSKLQCACLTSNVFLLLAVLVCVGIITFLYWATVDVLDLQHNPSIPHNDNVKVTFDVSFYLITAAGACSVIAVAFNCLRRKVVDAEPAPARAILDDQFNVDTENLLVIPPPSLHGQDFSPMSNLPPPPPYTPY
ncbi:transmembrane protein 127-like [Littorina saxatilis]|uniref:transmembrane protein 127-like n=1 Tax=Littorina saxatilis TaxID=31220 RepID=UPI0038B540FE